MTLSKHERIESRKKEIGTKHRRKLRKFSEGFNEIFYFFLKSYRAGILTFCGSEVKVLYNKESFEAKEGYRLFENGFFKEWSEEKKVWSKTNPYCRQNNVLQAVIIGKKSWGLHVDMWSDGIAECSFTEKEILQDFRDRNIIIPKPLLMDFYNTVDKKKNDRNLKELKRLKM